MDDLSMTGRAPYWVDSLDELPSEFHNVTTSKSDEFNRVVSILVVPETPSGTGKTPAQALIFTRYGFYYVRLPSSYDTGRDTWLSARELLCARLRRCYSKARLDLIGHLGMNITEINFEFDTENLSALQLAILDKLRYAFRISVDVSNDKTVLNTKIGHIDELPDPLAAVIHEYGLLENENVLGFVYHPDIEDEQGQLSSGELSQVNLMVLTDRQLILLEEKCEHSLDDNDWILTHYPRRVIDVISSRIANGRNELLIKLKSKAGTVNHNYYMAKEMVPEWEELWSIHNKPPQ